MGWASSAGRDGEYPGEMRVLSDEAPTRPPPVASDLAGLDACFVENVARDGRLLWARGPLPTALAPIAARWAARGG